MVISPFGFTRLSFATLPCRTQNLLWHDESVIANPLMSILLWLDASVGKLDLWLVVRCASTFLLLNLLLIQL